MRRFGALTAVAVGALAVLTAPSAIADAPNTCSAAQANRQQGVWLSDGIASSSDVDWFRFTTTSEHYALVTLGALSANLSLTLYDHACHKITSSDHGGRRYEEIYRDLPAGRYYARVAGDSGATSTYQLRFRPLRTGTFVLSSHAWNSGSQLNLAGEVLNNQGVARFVHLVQATFYDRFGHVLGHADMVVPKEVVRARQRVPFFDVETRPKNYDHYRLTVQIQALQSTFTGKPVTFLPGVPWTDSSGIHHFPGQLRNDGTQPIFFALALYTIYGSRGQVLYANEGQVAPGVINPGRLGLYDVMFDTLSGTNAIGKTAETS